MTPGILLCTGLDMECYAKKAAGTAFNAVVTALGEGVTSIVKFLSTFWLNLDSPTVATGGGNSYTPVKIISDMGLWLGPVTGMIAMCFFAAQVAQVARKAGSREETDKLLRQLFAVACGPMVVIAVTQVLITAGDAFTPWVIQQATGQEPGAGLKALLGDQLLADPTSIADAAGLWFLLFLLCLLGGLAQCIFMILRGPMLLLLMVFLAPTAAASSSAQGWHRFKRLVMLILGFVLYKPVSGIIYAFGLSMMTKNGDKVGNALYGLTVMTMAALALPAMIKFLAPDAAFGASNLASGAGLVGGVAAGAALLGGGFGAAAAGGSSSTAAPRPTSSKNPGGNDAKGSSNPPPSNPPGSNPPGSNPPGSSPAPSSPAGNPGPAPAPAAPPPPAPASAPPGGRGRNVADAVRRASDRVSRGAEETAEGSV